jgi:hypothetical protein
MDQQKPRSQHMPKRLRTVGGSEIHVSVVIDHVQLKVLVLVWSKSLIDESWVDSAGG